MGKGWVGAGHAGSCLRRNDGRVAGMTEVAGVTGALLGSRAALPSAAAQAAPFAAMVGAGATIRW